MTYDRFVERGTSLEPAAAYLGTNQTPLADFFVCTVGEPAQPDPRTWRLSIEGDAVREPLHLSMSDLADLPQREVDAWLECAGNGRSLFELTDERTLRSNETPWKLGAMGMASWRGPSLAAVLELAGVFEHAAWVSPAGLDHPNPEREPVRMCLPLHKALHPDTLVVLEMNGAQLEPMHGFPARLLVPGWVGAYSVKWLERIDVSSEWIPSWRADSYYRLRTPDGQDLGPAMAHPVKSSLALPWDTQLEAGNHQVVGYARASGVPIDRVEWKVDGGTWLEAELFGPNGAWTWSPFRFTWEASPGRHVLRTRATDTDGNTQPDEMPYHPDGILWCGVIPHPVTVS